MKIRLAEILDAMRFTDRVVLKNADGEILMDDAMQRVKLSKYRPWWVVRIDVPQEVYFSIAEVTIAEEECSFDFTGTPRLWEDQFYGPHLIEVTMSDDYIHVYELGVDVTEADLTEEERELLEESREYLKQKEIKQTAEQLRRARRDFEKLRDIPDMPEAAIKILQRWTYRHGDDEEDGTEWIR